MTAPQSIAFLEYRLSGGAANTDPNASLGGDMSSQRILNQSVAAPTNVTGVAIVDAVGNVVGNGTLKYYSSTHALTWTPNTGAEGTQVVVNGSDGRYVLYGGSGVGRVDVNVTVSSLPGSNQSDSLAVADLANQLWDDTTKTESFLGDTEYRGIYLVNTHPTDDFLDIVCYQSTGPSPGTMTIQKHPDGRGTGGHFTPSSITRSGSTASVNKTAHKLVTGDKITVAGAAQAEYNGTAITVTVDDADNFHYTVTGTPATPATGSIVVSSGVLVTIADENTAPSGIVTWNSGTTEGGGVDMLALKPGQAIGLWKKRTVPAKNTTANNTNSDTLTSKAYY